MDSHNMITFRQNGNWFTYRAVGIIFSPDSKKVLLHRSDDDPFWSLPGGRGEFFEPSRETVVREMKEEMGVETAAERLAFVIENFFEYGGYNCHELGFYYLLKAAPGCKIFEPPAFEGREGGQKLHFEWFEVSELESVELYPKCLRAKLKNFPEAIEHIVHRD